MAVDLKLKPFSQQLLKLKVREYTSFLWSSGSAFDKTVSRFLSQMFFFNLPVLSNFWHCCFWCRWVKLPTLRLYDYYSSLHILRLCCSVVAQFKSWALPHSALQFRDLMSPSVSAESCCYCPPSLPLKNWTEQKLSVGQRLIGTNFSFFCLRFPALCNYKCVHFSVRYKTVQHYNENLFPINIGESELARLSRLLFFHFIEVFSWFWFCLIKKVSFEVNLF